MAAYNGNSKFVIPRPILYKDGVNIGSIAVDTTLSYLSSRVQVLTNGTGGALTVHLPAEKNGANFWIGNDGASANAIHVKNPAGNVVANLAVGEGAFIVSDGTSWASVIAA